MSTLHDREVRAKRSAPRVDLLADCAALQGERDALLSERDALQAECASRNKAIDYLRKKHLLDQYVMQVLLDETHGIPDTWKSHCAIPQLCLFKRASHACTGTF